MRADADRQVDFCLPARHEMCTTKDHNSGISPKTSHYRPKNLTAFPGSLTEDPRNLIEAPGNLTVGLRKHLTANNLRPSNP